MTKPSTNESDKGNKPGMTAEQEQVPGRTVGVSVMCAMILFVAFWMNRQDVQTSDQRVADSVVSDDVAGFRSDAWFLPDDDLLGFVKIPAGTFTMGSNPALDRLAYENERWSNTRRQGSVELPDYYIGKFEVSVAQFDAFVQAQPQQADPLQSGQEENHPIANITWPEALAYGRWLEEQLKNSPQTPTEIKQFLDQGAHVTLPSEAEWEKAARGTDGRVFPWGSQFRAELVNSEAASVVAVGSLPCGDCAYGITGMSGNVWELTRSPLQPYPYNPDDDAESLSADALWVMRGGAYSDGVNNLRAAVRGAVDPGVRNSTIGFRVVISNL